LPHLLLVRTIHERPSHAARVRVLYDPERHRGPTIWVSDPAMSALAFEALALWCLGYPDRASERGLAALAMAQTAAHPFSLCWALRWEAVLRIERREPELMAARTKALLMVAREQGFAQYCATGSMLEIWHDAWVTGQCADDRIEAFRSCGLAELRRMGGLLSLGLWHVLFAECLEKQGNTDEALKALEAAVVHFERRGSDAHWEPEVHGLTGDLPAAQPERSGSGGRFLSAGDRARPFARGKVVGIARRHQPRPAVARPRQAH
jgi:hypothetical protein